MFWSISSKICLSQPKDASSMFLVSKVQNHSPDLYHIVWVKLALKCLQNQPLLNWLDLVLDAIVYQVLSWTQICIDKQVWQSLKMIQLCKKRPIRIQWEGQQKLKKYAMQSFTWLDSMPTKLQARLSTSMVVRVWPLEVNTLGMVWTMIKTVDLKLENQQVLWTSSSKNGERQNRTQQYKTHRIRTSTNLLIRILLRFGPGKMQTLIWLTSIRSPRIINYNSEHSWKVI